MPPCSRGEPEVIRLTLSELYRLAPCLDARKLEVLTGRDCGMVVLRIVNPHVNPGICWIFISTGCLYTLYFIVSLPLNISAMRFKLCGLTIRIMADMESNANGIKRTGRNCEIELLRIVLAFMVVGFHSRIL